MTMSSQALLAAQARAAALFDEVVASGLIRAGIRESELSLAIHELARQRHGVRRHWHRRVVRAGPNTLSTYEEDPPDRVLCADDILFLDFGPVFDGWEADYGRSYVLGDDPDKHRLVADIDAAFRAGRALFEATPQLTAGALYDFVCGEASRRGWSFGAASAGHLVGAFPHETAPGAEQRLSIRHGNAIDLRERDAAGEPRHWILEIHFVDRAKGYGAFCEALLTA